METSGGHNVNENPDVGPLNEWIYCSHTQKSHHAAARVSSLTGFLIPRSSFISVSSQPWKVWLGIAAIFSKYGGNTESMRIG